VILLSADVKKDAHRDLSKDLSRIRAKNRRMQDNRKGRRMAALIKRASSISSMETSLSKYY
jgi:hypothetical protein